ncbi:hypothetical protein VD0002_g5595 [Verticillium dahliae]|uniref:Uncharacterized protein n=1 Tax=Verticillium dahliae TaxID=27337 RepID=A0AA44W8Y3_VERDA|nr:hypothetical protein BJF96_g10230 [Verticillium dahliae]PNH50006.1 hypothetical protein VD0003_g7166 [Verticillium dahliae]PNH62459.1 hypothetical protein VD0002_g5595 [Verticillium dahliae]
MMGTPFAELHDTSRPPELSDTGLSPMEIIDKHTHFGTSPYPTSIQPTYYYGSVSDKEILSPSGSSGVLGPYNLAESPAHGVSSPVDTIVGMRDRGWPTVSGISKHDTGHVRQISEVTISSASDADNYFSVPLVVSPFDTSAIHGPPLVLTPISPTIVSPAPKEAADRGLEVD